MAPLELAVEAIHADERVVEVRLFPGSVGRSLAAGSTLSLAISWGPFR